VPDDPGALPSAHLPLVSLPSSREAFVTWARIALLSFGGPAGQIAVMHRILVDEKRWISERRFLHALNYCMLLPGPEAHQLAVYIGWLMHRVRGGIVSGTLFVLPGLIALGVLSWIYAAYGQVGLVAAAFFGLKAAVLAIVLEAVLRIGRRALKTPVMVAVAALAFVAIFFLQLPFPLIVLGAGLLGYLAQPLAPHWFSAAAHGQARSESLGVVDKLFAQGVPAHVRPSTKRLLGIALIGGVLWFAPLLVLLAWLGPGNVFTAIAAFNSKMAVVTFGGAYAVLSYMAQQAVEFYHWLQPGEMLVGLGLAETTPGPLISVVQFVGFMAAARQAVGIDPMLAGTLGGLLAMWCTFVPSFLWIFMGAPYVEALLGNHRLNAALSAVTAAVVGIILNLAIWFGLHTLFASVDQTRRFGVTLNIPDLASLNLPALVLALAAMIAMFRFRLGVIPVLLASCLAGMAFYLV
jgi:chromate transporter